MPGSFRQVSESRRALLSVYDKSGVVDLARGLTDIGWELISSGGTARVIADAGIPVTDRRHASSIAIITGHEADGKRKDSVDWAGLAHAADTLVVLGDDRNQVTVPWIHSSRLSWTSEIPEADPRRTKRANADASSDVCAGLDLGGVHGLSCPRRVWWIGL